jgi:molybdopterin synthase catalytic subunit
MNICDELRRKPGVIDVQIHHLLGEFSVGEDLVYVLVAGSHRENIFSVLEEAVERYKSEAPIFKKEHVLTEKGEKKACWLSERENR